MSPKINEFYRLRQLKGFFGDKPLCELKPRDIEEWKAQTASENQASTLNRSLTALKGLLNKAVEWSRLEVNPALKIKKLRETNQKVRYLTEGEINKLLGVAKSPGFGNSW